MGRKRANDDEAGPSKRPIQRNEVEQPAQPQPNTNRRQDMAQIARQRAAHFATWQAGDTEEYAADNPHVGGETARSLGPWSSAVQLANAREAQRERRDAKLKEAQSPDGQHQQKKKDSVPPIWSPSRDLKLPRTFCDVKPLVEIGLDLVVQYIEDVESLYGLPDMIKSRIAVAVCRHRAITPSIFHLFCLHTPTEVSIPDCSQIEPSDMEASLAESWSPHLQKLSLGLCGRGLTDATTISLTTTGASLPALRTLHLSGGYRLGDAALIGLLEKMPGLVSLSLPQFSRLKGPVVEALPGVTPHLEELDLRDCRGVGGEMLRVAFKELKSLKTVVLDAINEVDDALVAYLATHCTSLERLSLRLCPSVTDASLMSLASSTPGLLALSVDECKITNQGVVALTQGCHGLHAVSLNGCRKVDDAGVKTLAMLGTLRSLHLNTLTQLTDASLEELAKWSKATLEEIDVSWCRLVTSTGLGLLADACRGLREVRAWGCSQLDERFLLGHSNEGLKVVGRGERVQQVALPLQKY